MKITKVNIPKSQHNNGLEDVRMSRLGKIVLIAGKNGSGKTRLLNKIRKCLDQKPGITSLTEAEGMIEHFRPIIERSRVKYQHMDHQNDVDPSQKRALEESSDKLVALTENSQRILDWNFLETDIAAEIYPFIDFVPKSLQMDNTVFSKAEIITLATNARGKGFDFLMPGTIASLQRTQDIYFESTHRDSIATEEMRIRAKTEYDEVQNLMNTFLEGSLGRNLDGYATIFGRPIDQAGLSDGQKALLQFCVAVYNQSGNLRDSVLIMDEPENHLHPSIVVKTVDRIVESVTHGQIWIATHSVPLLAHFDPGSIWYMEKGSVSYAGNIPEKVLSSLLGDEEEIEKLHDFIGLPAQLASNRFAYECLFEPGVASTGKNDPQIVQIMQQLGNVNKNGKIKVLDYGAGKGRILANIPEGAEFSRAFAERYDYIAFDKFEDDRQDCCENLARAYGSADERYFNNVKDLLCCHDTASFDVVLMTNVLHEIDPKEWLELFVEGGTVSSLLCEKGALIVVEDTQVPVGEMAYQNGFIVLDTPQFKELFNMKQAEFRVSDARKDGRLKCHMIPKWCIIRITPESRISALESLREVAKTEIRRIRTSERNYKNGKLHGYWIQQLANITLALSELKGKIIDEGPRNFPFFDRIINRIT